MVVSRAIARANSRQEAAESPSRPAPLTSWPDEEYRLDPRPDLADDHTRWRELLGLADKLLDADAAEGLYGWLHAARICGVRLLRDDDGAYLDAPECREAGADYQVLKARLTSAQGDRLVALLTRVTT